MYRWTTKAVLLSLAINDANGNPLIPENLSLSTAQAQLVHEENDDGFNDGSAVLEWLSECAGADLDTETCLVSKTLDALINMDGPSQDDDASFPTRRRFLQEEGECRPELSEQDLRNLMVGSRAECNQVSIEYTNQYFEGVFGEFWKVFSSEHCWNELCNSPDIFVKLMFDHAMQCANVEFDVDECITDQIITMMFAGPDSYDDDYYTDDYYNYTDDGTTISSPNHRVVRSLQDVMTDCVAINEFELAYFASFVLMEAEGRCAELGVFVTPEDISKASADLVKLFSSPHCFGDAHACPDDDGNDAYHGGGHLDHFAIGVKYVEQCANIELNLDSCLTTKTFDFFKSLDSSPSMHRPRQLQESDNVGEENCTVPEIDDTMLNAITFEAKQQCIAATGTPISDQEYSSSVEVMRDFLDAQSCWQSLCEEGENPSRMLLEIIFEEIGICAQADLDAIDQCLLNQVFELLFNSEESPAEDGIGDLRRKLQRSLSDQDMPIPNDSEPSDEPCVEQPDDAELYFVVNLLLAGASEVCDVSSLQVSQAETELFKLFRAESCWGESSGCEHDDNHDSPVDASYLEFVENNAIDMLAQCAEVTDATSCVFWRSLETLRFMGGGDAKTERSNGPLLQHAFQEVASNICIPPFVTDDDINQIVDHAKEHCFYNGLPVESHHKSQAVADLKKLMAKPDCFEDLCSTKSREMIVEEWLSECASLDTRFLTRSTNHLSDYSSQPLDNDTLRCMTRYLMQTQSQTGFQDPWECSLPQISPSICGFDPTNASDIMKEAFMYCSGGEMSHPPSPSPDTSMSFGYNNGDLGDLDNWDDNWPDVGDTYFSYSMSYSWQGVGQDTGNHHEHDGGNTSAMLPYVLEVCHLLGDLDSEQSRKCLKPVCEWGIEGALSFDDSDDMVVLEDKTDSPSRQPSRQPTSQPTSQPTRQPTRQPTKRPTSSPTASPTALETGVVEVKFEVAMTLSGIETSNIDITSLNSVVALLEDVIQEMLPDGAKARIIKVGGFSLTRRMLQENSSLGVDVEFEVIFSEICSEETCNDSKDTLLKEADVFSSDIVAKVEDGSLSKSIKEKAGSSSDLSESLREVFKNISVSPTSLKVSDPLATVIIKKEQEEEVPEDDSAAHVQRLTLSVALIAAAAAVW
eukprot:scaffold9235_cov152-Skeletonema_menzelii.AAC.5